MIDGMVNWSIFEKRDLVGPTTLFFRSDEHAKLYVILLTDFLSKVSSRDSSNMAFELTDVPSNARGADLTFLFHLRHVCEAPQFNGNSASLRASVNAFASWLEERFTSRDVNLASIDVLAELEISRYRYIKMCGNIAKHSLARLNRNVKDLRKLLKSAGHDVSIQDAYLAMDDFFVWYFDDVFKFHANHITEFLNDIRWEIYQYLLPEYKRSWHTKNEFYGDYGYRVPASIAEPFAQAMYWDLMNRVRGRPYLPRFVVNESFKRPHLSESFSQVE